MTVLYLAVDKFKVISDLPQRVGSNLRGGASWAFGDIVKGCITVVSC